MVTSLSCDCPSRQYYSVLRIILVLLRNLRPNHNSNTSSNVQHSSQSTRSFHTFETFFSHITRPNIITVKSRITHPSNCDPMTTLQFIGGFPINTDSKRQIFCRQSTSTDMSSIYKHLLKCWPWFLSLVQVWIKAIKRGRLSSGKNGRLLSGTNWSGW